MVEVRKVLSVFLASPGDLVPERRYAKECVDEWNHVNSERTTWTVNLMGWEDTLPQRGRPQDLINREVRRSHLFVGLMWKRWGTAPGGEEGFTSGFEEEFELANKLFEEGGIPNIAMFFKAVQSIEDPGVDLERVIAFKKRIVDGKKVLYREIEADENTWKTEFRRTLHRLIYDQIEAIEQQEDAPSDAQPTANTSTVSIEDNPETTLTGGSLAQRLAAALAGVGSEDDLSVVQVAQLRLIALSIPRSGLSTLYLGTHDANIIYRARAEIDLTEGELRALIDCALSQISSESAPLWTWVTRHPQGINHLTHRALTVAEERASIGALKALMFVGDSLGGAERAILHGNLQSSKDSALKAAILGFIGATGSVSDVTVLATEIEKGEYSTSPSALKAALDILCRNSVKDAATFLISTNAKFAQESVIEKVLSKFSALPDDTLELGLTHIDGRVRSAAAKQLSDRGHLTPDKAIALRDDPDPFVRLQALISASRAGEMISDQDARKILVRKKLPAANLFARGVEEGTDALSEFRKERISTLGDDALLSEMREFYSPSEIAYERYVSKNFISMRPQLRHDLADSFASFYETVKQSYRLRLGTQMAEQVIGGFEPLQAFRVNQMSRAGLNVLVEKGDSGDLAVVRLVLSQDGVSIKEADLSYLSKHGEWADIGLIDQKINTSPGLGLGSYNTRLSDLAYKSIYGIGKGRFAELLADGNLSVSTLAGILRVAEKTQVANLARADLVALLNSESAEVRKTAALRAISIRGKRELTEILRAYTQQKRYFYNVVYWLDFGQNATKATIHRALKLELRS
jgi:hypothetical protein